MAVFGGYVSLGILVAPFVGKLVTNLGLVAHRSNHDGVFTFDNYVNGIGFLYLVVPFHLFVLLLISFVVLFVFGLTLRSFLKLKEAFNDINKDLE